MINYIKSFKHRSPLLSALLLLPVTALLISFLIPMRIRIVNEGNILGAGFCAGVILLWLLYPLIKRNKRTLLALRILTGLITAGLIYATVLTIGMLTTMWWKTPPEIRTPSEHQQYTIIVLGCHVQNGIPSTMLVQRLITAHDFLSEYEAVQCVTTGGYGAGQAYSEAEVSRNWLVRRDVCESRIFLEDSSTNTFQNLTFARDVINEHDLPQNVIIVSDGFHLWRASMVAETLFDGEVYVIPAKTRPAFLLPTYWVREWFALTRDFINPELFG
jgi:uncharacterized SAM-binding protein YcdF (DUF218 family)